MASKFESITFPEFVKSHPYGKLLIPIASVLGLGDFAKSFATDGKIPWVLIILVVVIGSFFVAKYRLLKPVRLMANEEAKWFFPFHSGLKGTDKDRFRIPRAGELLSISEQIRDNAERHTVISGESGAGKSTLIDMYIGQTSKALHKTLIEESVGSAQDILSAIMRLDDSKRNIEIDDASRTFLSAVKNGASEAELDSAIDGCIRTAERVLYRGKTLVVIFEQSERLIAIVRSLGKNELQLFNALVEALRRASWVRTVFVCRSDQIARVLSDVPPDSFEIAFIPSLGRDNEDTSSADFRRRFLRICSKEEYEVLLKATTRNCETNTFILSLTGYIVESLGPRQIVQDPNPHGYDGANQILDIYFRLLRQEFDFIHRDTNAGAYLEIVLHGLALYNQRTSMSCDKAVLAKLTHLPMQRVDEVVDYLIERGVVYPDKDRPELIRLAHDLVASHLLSRELQSLRMDHAQAMQQIIDRRLDKARLIDVVREEDPFVSVIQNMRFNIAATLLWLSVIAYLLRLAFPEYIFPWLGTVNSTIDRWLPGLVDSTGANWWLFAPIALTQYIWAYFIYGLSRGFFAYVTKREKRPIMQVLLDFCGAAGAAMGFTLSFAPPLFVIPIVLPGMFLAGCYLVLSLGKSNEKLVDKYFRRLGYATLWNMAIGLLLCAGLTELFVWRHGGYPTRDSISIFLLSGLFCYSAYAMRELQGSERGRAAMLTVYDAGRTETSTTAGKAMQ